MLQPARLGLLVAGAIGLDLLVWDGATRTTTGAQVPWWLPVIVTVAAYQTLWLLRARPSFVLAALSAFALVSMLVPKWQPFTGLLLAAYAAPAQRGARATGPLLAGVLVALGSHSYASGRLTESPLSATVTLLLLWVVLAGAIWGLGARSYVRSRETWCGRRLLLARAERDLITERLRIARDLHDGVSGAVTAIYLQAAGARCAQPTAQDLAARSLAAIESSAERTLVELRQVVGSLRTAHTGCAPGSQPKLAELPDLVAFARQAGLVVTLTENGARQRTSQLDAAAEEAVVRAVQESLTNVLKHAGPGTRCEVALAWAETALSVTVESRPVRCLTQSQAADLPSGWSAKQGLHGLMERATLVGGHLEAGQVGDGFIVRLTVPSRATVRT